MQYACGVLHLSPQIFWNMTPRELALTLPRRRNHGLPRRVLAELIQAFPDRRNEDG